MTQFRAVLILSFSFLAFGIWITALYHLHKFSEISNFVDYWQTFTQPYNNDFAHPVEPIWSSLKSNINDLEWFIHVSDLHINEYTGEGKENFKGFLEKLLPLVKPLFVVCTGDLTDAKDPYSLRTYQNEPEWQYYSSSLRSATEKFSSDRPLKDWWFDLPGNHDRFDVDGDKRTINMLGLNSVLNVTISVLKERQDYYKIYGVQKESGYKRTIYSSKLGSDIAIVAVDGCPYPGLARPFNFFGYLNKPQLEVFNSQIASLENPTLFRIVLSHYPLCTLLFESPKNRQESFGDMSQSFALYLSGHLHNLAFGIGEELLAIHPASGLGDFEVGDLKSSKMFRIGVFSKDRSFSFTDFRLQLKDQGACYVHILYPRDARTQLDRHESPRANKSDAIELLVFINWVSSIALPALEVSIDHKPVTIEDSVWNESVLRAASRNGIPTVIRVPFDLKSLSSKESHLISMSIRDEKGNRLHDKQYPFRLDGQAAPFTNFGHSIMNFSFKRSCQWIFWIVFCILFFVALVLPRVLSRLYVSSKSIDSTEIGGKDPIYYSLSDFMWTSWIRLTKCGYFYYPWLLYFLYMPIFPLFCGPFSSHSSSVNYWFSFYIFGIKAVHDDISVSDPLWFPLVDTWEFTLFFLLGFILPSYLLLIYRASTRPSSVRTASMHRSVRFIRSSFSLSMHALIFFWWIIQGGLVGLVGMAYGWFALLLSPGITWFYSYNLLLYYWILPHVYGVQVESKTNKSSDRE